MLVGYMGKLLFVDFSTGEIKDETPDEGLYRNFIGGYGVGARILYSRQKVGVDPLRHVFTLREGINPLKRFFRPRIIGRPPQKEGPLADMSIDIEAQIYWNFGALDWDPETTKPCKKKLMELGLNDVAEEQGKAANEPPSLLPLCLI